MAAAPSSLIAVMGDVMVDKYYWGSVQRISPEAPVPVVDVQSESVHLGGAANVAKNITSLGAQSLLCGVVGSDSSATTLRQLAEDAGINTAGVFEQPQRPTTVKARVMGNNQHVVRLDTESTMDVPLETIALMLETIIGRNTQAIILEDYNKGMFTPESIALIMRTANEHSLPVFVDPKFKNFFHFNNAFLVKPNRKEAEDAVGKRATNEHDLSDIGTTLLKQLNAQYVLLTLGAHGMALFQANGSGTPTIHSVPTIAKRVSDVSGAGDTTIATLATLVCAGASMAEAATLANIAAGVVVAEPGIVAITPEQIIEQVRALAPLP
jgi:rfaE bifunctional protein kinase chain/domain